MYLNILTNNGSILIVEVDTLDSDNMTPIINNILEDYNLDSKDVIIQYSYRPIINWIYNIYDEQIKQLN